MTVTCRECGATFDLSNQHYYDNLCPECMADHAPERTWPGCAVCGERVPPEDRTTIRVRGAARDPAWVTLPAHHRCATGRAERRQPLP